jgi:hypothetical protein
MRNLHVWKTRTAEGVRREVRAQLFGGKWTFEAKASDEEEWTAYPEPTMEDLLGLRSVLSGKYRRSRIPREHLSAVERTIRERGGSWEE